MAKDKITREDLNLLKERKWVKFLEDGSIESNPHIEELLKKSFEDLSEEDKDTIKFWVNIYKKNNRKTMSTFVLSEDEVIKNKAFPIDYHEDIFYYGLLLPKNVDDEIKGKKIGKKQVWVPVLITSRRELVEFTEIVKQEMGIKFENIPTALPRRWRLENIREYLYGTPNNFERSDLLNAIINQYKKYLYIRNEVWYKVHALWDIGTYLYQIFEAYPFFELRGIAGTGKTKAMTISSYITFNGGQIMANPSESTLFRETDEVRGTKYFDEAEKLWVFNKATRKYEGDVRTELINSSYTKEAKVPRQEKIGNRFITKWYSPYSPCMLGSINGLYGATETRAVTRITTKSLNEDSRGEVEPSEDREDVLWSDIRDMCYRFGLENWREIKDLYNNFPKEFGLKRRDYQIWKPILTLAKFIDENLFNEVVNFAKEITERRTNDLIAESSFDYLCLESLKNAIVENKESEKIYVELIKQEYCKIKGVVISNDPYLNRNISNHLDNLGFKELRARDRYGSFFAVNQMTYNEIVSPTCPNLAFLSTSIVTSSHLHIKNNEKRDDSMTMCDDKSDKNVTMMTMCDENVDTYEKNNIPKLSDLTPEEREKIAPECLEFLKQQESENERMS